ncbi:MAG TPA: hypothetical protein VGH90_03160 [Chthoniobacteraceae bacterium]|jgi:hypothetical protein
MKSLLLSVLAALAAFTTVALRADEPSTPGAEELEARFKAAMTGVTMTGRWCPVKDGALGAEKDDKYSIVSVEKVSGSSWIINARMRHGDQEAVIPIPVQVKWAGDTAVIIVDHMKLPGGNAYEGNAYSARVLIHDGTYAGTWSGGDHGGLLKGVIVKDGAASK